jgi:hypothetical protein
MEFSILDPACGSGSFLLQAFWLLNVYYQKISTLLMPLKSSNQQQALNLQMKAFFGNSLIELEILIVQRHLFGIDKDPQAIDLTSLNLWLAIKEICENPSISFFPSNSYDSNMLFKVSMIFNLVNGDSLFGLPNQDVISLRSDRTESFLENCNLKLYSTLKTKKIASDDIDGAIPVYFPVMFPTCFYDKNSHPKRLPEQGFDVIVGNPPYQRAATVVKWKKFYLSRFSSVYGAGDIFVPFIELSLQNLKENGILGMIISNKILLKDYAKKIREQLLQKEIIELMDLTPCHSIFEDALVAPLIFQVKNIPYPNHNPNHRVRIRLFQSDHPEYLIAQDQSNRPYIEEYRLQSNLINSQGHFALKISANFQSLISKIYSDSKLYKDIASITTGLMGFDYEKVSPFVFDSYASDSSDDLPFIPNGLILPYQLIWGKKKCRLFKQQFVYPRMKKNPIVTKDAWKRYQAPKILVRGVAKYLTAAYDPIGWAISVEVIGIQCNSVPIYVQLALLNSELYNWLHLLNYLHGRIPRGSLNYPKPFIEQLPIKNSEEFTRIANQIVPILEKMLPSEKHREEIVKKLDDAVYSLYDLNMDEIFSIKAFLQTISH